MSDNGDMDILYQVGNGTLIRVWQMADRLLDELIVRDLKCMPSLMTQEQVDEAVMEHEFRIDTAKELAIIIQWQKPQVPIGTLIPSFKAGDGE